MSGKTFHFGIIPEEDSFENRTEVDVHISQK
jgi:hypothetical protein